MAPSAEVGMGTGAWSPRGDTAWGQGRCCKGMGAEVVGTLRRDCAELKKK